MVIKLQRWALKLEQGSFNVFPVLHDFLETNEVNIDKSTTTTIRDHLESLSSNLRNYFPKIEEEIQWIRNPFEEDYSK
ncbi:Hypothetical protein CINCED_3A021613 [Cinara cedri]|uniref:Uncharacterized protein n=1 Tax=Cinara cedri TaxID=506608 RepID=A0A5E4MFI8_9HEMI|nr:Hypothetical protein CINCED_3A021613 [Cinara cedri]